MPPSVINLVLVVGVWLTLVIGCCDFAKRGSNNNNSNSTPDASPSSTESNDSSAISAVDLFNEWKKDKDAAETKYKGKSVRVTGKVRLAKDTSIVLNSGEKSDILGVQCILADSDRGRTSGLSVGQSLTVEGVCVGRIGNIVLKPCSIR